MNKKIFIVTMLFLLFLIGCGKTNGKNAVQQTKKSTSTSNTIKNEDNKSENTNTVTSKSQTIDYSNYTKKVWVIKNVADYGIYNNSSFCITKIANNKITGIFTVGSPALPNKYDLGQLSGVINKNTAECEFSDKSGDKGTMKLIFSSNNDIEAKIQFNNNPPNNNPKLNGTFQFRPYKPSDMDGFSIIKNQSFMVNLNSWGNVRFVSAKLLGGNHVPTLFYLTDKDGDFIYDFTAELPYSVDVAAVSFQDLNKDGLKDIIIICRDAYHVPAGTTGKPIADVYFQKSDGSFECDTKLNQELNESGNNNDIKTIVNYISNNYTRP
ncbi:hypothetical protein [Clostridium hydrogenum]|uniref:hypothetical protein n=1 Tax=Clostridium hydrogenum TaxID=2855764 RepID=UPI001F36406F|nr:hypothetical protein [Clostridium hydrogenum]